MSNLSEVLDYWFGDEPDDLQVIRQRGKRWFGKDERVDAEIGERFGAMVEETGRIIRTAATDLSTAERLAKIILLDQFPRNIYRGEARSFAFDAAALSLTLAGLQLRQDQQLRFVERVFFYLPLEHSELLEHQDRSVALFQQLFAEVPEGWKSTFQGFLDYAVRHQQIIARFGRFPHRNKILGRQSTAEETDFLAQPNSSF